MANNLNWRWWRHTYSLPICTSVTNNLTKNKKMICDLLLAGIAQIGFEGKGICLCNECSLACDDWIMVGIGFLTTVFWAIIIYSLKPNLKIHEPKVERINNRPVIFVPVENCSPYFKATRIHLEVAMIEEKFTYHLKTDVNDFVFIPRKKDGDNIRTFKAYKLNEFLTECYPNIQLEDLINSNLKIRIRIHATHPFSGLGKCYEYPLLPKN